MVSFSQTVCQFITLVWQLLEQAARPVVRGPQFPTTSTSGDLNSQVGSHTHPDISDAVHRTPSGFQCHGIFSKVNIQRTPYQVWSSQTFPFRRYGWISVTALIGLEILTFDLQTSDCYALDGRMCSREYNNSTLYFTNDDRQLWMPPRRSFDQALRRCKWEH